MANKPAPSILICYYNGRFHAKCDKCQTPVINRFFWSIDYYSQSKRSMTLSHFTILTLLYKWALFKNQFQLSTYWVLSNIWQANRILSLCNVTSITKLQNCVLWYSYGNNVILHWKWKSIKVVYVFFERISLHKDK